MGLLLSKILQENDIFKDIEYKIINEQEFDLFSRLTTDVEGYKCVFLNSKKYISHIGREVRMIITTNDIACSLSGFSYGVCATENPRGLFFELLRITETKKIRDKRPTVIGKNCRIGRYSNIARYGVVIGDNTVIEDFVIVNENVEIGENCTIQSGAKIGIQDFNLYEFKNILKQAKHNGNTVIGNNVMIGNNAVIGQALYDYGVTKIGDNCNIGANTIVGHNDSIGENTEICAGTAIGGYVNIGRNCLLSIGCYLKNELKIGNNSKVNIGSVVIRDVGEGETVFGNPARRVVSPN